MPSIHKVQGTPYWHCFFYLPDGRRTHRSTGTSDKRKALSVCMKMADAAALAKEGRLIEARARATIADIFAVGNSQALPSAQVKAYLEGWLDRKRLEVSGHSAGEYERVAREFTGFLGARANRPMDSVTVADVAAFRDHLAQRVAGATVNKILKILGGAWTHALRDGVVPVNVVSRLEPVKVARSQCRRAFTQTELRKLIDAATPEWRSMVLFGLYTGQRLGDIAALTWRNIDVEAGEIRLQTGKTGRQQILPIAAPLARHIATLSTEGDPGRPVHPKAHGIVSHQGRVGTLSRQFHEVMAAAGLVERRSHAAHGEGRSGRRAAPGISFHALRHTATSLMKNAGVSPAIVEEFVGHESAAVSRVYTHIETAALRRAADALPDIVAPEETGRRRRAAPAKGRSGR